MFNDKILHLNNILRKRVSDLLLMFIYTVRKLYDVTVTKDCICERYNCCVAIITLSITRSAFRSKGYYFQVEMFGHSKPVMLSLFVVFTVSIALLQENTFERVSIKYGKVISISQARSVFTCVESCLQHCECRFVRFTKINNTCQLFADVLLYYGSNSMPSSSDVVDFKKVCLKYIHSNATRVYLFNRNIFYILYI